MPNEKTRHQLLAAVAAFRLEKGRWPLSAFELSSFARSAGKTLDLSPFHLLRFLSRGPQRLTLDWMLLPDDRGWAAAGWLFVEVKQQGRDQLGWGAEWAQGEPLKLEAPSCLVTNGVRRAG